MSSPVAGGARLSRGACLAVLTVALSAVAHGLGGGALPPLGMLGGLAAVLFPVCVWVGGRRVRPLAAGALLAIGQAALHGAYSVLMSCPAPGAAPTELVVAGHPGHAGTQMAVHCAAATGRPALGAASMLVFHAVAVLATAAIGSGAERLARWLNDELAARLTPPSAVPLVVGRAHASALWSADAPTGALHLRAPSTRRGPPRRPLAIGVLPA